MKSYENKIKEALDERRISPSEEAWEKLENRLAKKPRRSFGKIYWWTGIAALFVIGLLLSGLVFNQSPSRPAKVVSTERQHQSPEVKEHEQPALYGTDSGDKKIDKTGLVIADKKKEESPKSTQTKSLQKQAIAVQDSPVNKGHDQQKLLTEHNEESLKQERQPEVASTKNQQDMYAVTDAEVNKLLQQARLRLQSDSAFHSTGNMVNAHALLKEVQSEIQNSLNKPLMRAIKIGLAKVKTMLASR